MEFGAQRSNILAWGLRAPEWQQPVPSPVAWYFHYDYRDLPGDIVFWGGTCYHQPSNTHSAPLPQDLIEYRHKLVFKGDPVCLRFIRVAHFLFYSPEVLWIMALQRYSHLSSQNLFLNMFLSMALGTSQIFLINSGIWGGEVILGYLSRTNIITKALVKRRQESQRLVGAEVRAMRPGVREAGSWKRHGTDYPIYFRRNIALVLNAACKIWLWLLTSKTVR